LANIDCDHLLLWLNGAEAVRKLTYRDALSDKLRLATTQANCESKG